MARPFEQYRIIGKRFGSLVVRSIVREAGMPRAKAWATCDCGRTVLLFTHHLKRQGSCGCAGKERQRAAVSLHGDSQSAEYAIWNAMRQRCENPKSTNYERYGGRGITLCRRWHDYTLFLADIGRRPSASYSLERKDNNGPYCAINCVWILRERQALNRRNNHLVTIGGESLPIAEWCRRLGRTHATIRMRIHTGWDPVEALTTTGKYARNPKSGTGLTVRTA
jgi:hypothetical protein